jgi:predicted RND superfamily exporter protein
VEIAHITEMPLIMVEQVLQFYGMTQGSLPPTEITLYDFLRFMSEQNPQDETLHAMLGEMEAGRSMLVGENFSRLIINTNLPLENSLTFEFVEQLTRDMQNNLSGEFYIIGESAIAHEMNMGFRSELNLITILTVIAFFIVAALSFRSLPISAILVCVIQSSVFITMATAHLFGDGIMFLALIIAQCLLKSRIIDYGVLYTANYVEARKTDDVKSATKNALNNSIHTIITSGLIIVVITFVLGLIFIDLNIAISEILLLVSQGCAIGVILTIFVLPSLMAVFDGAIHKSKS